MEQNSEDNADNISTNMETTTYTTSFNPMQTEPNEGSSTTELRSTLAGDTQEGLKIAHAILSNVEQHGDLTQLCSAEQYSAKQTLHEIVDIFATNKVEDRQFVRRLLKTIYTISRHIDRNVILFEEASTLPADLNYAQIRDKFLYILENVAGWKISPEDDPWNTADIDCNVTCYLDLPVQRFEEDRGTATILAEALYYIKNADFLLEILRHTIDPNAFYLWPVLLSADLKILENMDLMEPHEAVEEEAQIMKYVCRAHPGFQRILVGGDSNGSSRTANIGAYSENWLMMPASTAFLVPDDWCSNPCPLTHSCRLAVRSQLHEADTLPKGISHLPVPLALQKYIDLQY